MATKEGNILCSKDKESCCSCSDHEYGILCNEAKLLVSRLQLKKSCKDGKAILSKAEKLCKKVESLSTLENFEDVRNLLLESKQVFGITYRNRDVISLLKETCDEGKRRVLSVRIAECSKGHCGSEPSLTTRTSLFTNMMYIYAEAVENVEEVRDMHVCLLEALPMCIPVVDEEHRPILKKPQDLSKLVSKDDTIALDFLSLYMRFQIGLLRLRCDVTSVLPIGTCRSLNTTKIFSHTHTRTFRIDGIQDCTRSFLVQQESREQEQFEYMALLKRHAGTSASASHVCSTESGVRSWDSHSRTFEPFEACVRFNVVASNGFGSGRGESGCHQCSYSEEECLREYVQVEEKFLGQQDRL